MEFGGAKYIPRSREESVDKSVQPALDGSGESLYTFPTMNPLILAFFSACILAWSAQTPAAKPAEKTPQEAAFEAAFTQTVTAAAKAFAEDQPIPHLALPTDAAVWSRYAGELDSYAVLSAQMSYIQARREPKDSPEAFTAMIRHVARKVHVDEDGAVMLYGDRTRDAAAQGGGIAQIALRAGLIAEILNTKKVSPTMQKELAAKLEKTRQALLRNLRDDGSSASANAVEKSWITHQYRDPVTIDSVLPQVQPVIFKIKDVPGSEPPRVLKSESIFAYLDWDKAKTMAREVWDNAKGFTGYCYAYVKDALDAVLPKGWRSQVGQSSAYQFASSLNRNPKLFDKLKLRKIDPNTIPDGIPPVGAIIVYGRGMCGFSPEHGHIEIVVATQPPRACSDGCMNITASRLSCIKRYSSRNWVNVYVPVRTPNP